MVTTFSSAPVPARRRFSFAQLASTVALVTAATVVPLAAGSPASAASVKPGATIDNCTVVPKKPVVMNNGRSVRYPVRISCTVTDSTVKIFSTPWEEDGEGNPDDQTSSQWVGEVHIKKSDPVTVYYERTAPNTEGGKWADEEVYHQVEFQVRPPWNIIYGQKMSAGRSGTTIIDQTP